MQKRRTPLSQGLKQTADKWDIVNLKSSAHLKRSARWRGSPPCGNEALPAIYRERSNIQNIWRTPWATTNNVPFKTRVLDWNGILKIILRHISMLIITWNTYIKQLWVFCLTQARMEKNNKTADKFWTAYGKNNFQRVTQTYHVTERAHFLEYAHFPDTSWSAMFIDAQFSVARQ